MSKPSFSDWLLDNGIESVETIVPDFAGLPRGKVQPVAHFGDKTYKMPIAVFGQTINGTYYMRPDNVEDRDMLCRPDLATLRLVPWASEPTACVMFDCADMDGEPVHVAPRAVLQRVLRLFGERGWQPVIAPEVEFYLQDATAADLADIEPAGDEAASLEEVPDPYGIDRLHDLGGLIQTINEHCREQNIAVGAISQELGAGQFEVNFDHGDPLRLADDVFHFKRTLKRVALAHGLRATFLSKLDPEMPGSSMHLHQSVYDEGGNNVFSDAGGETSKLFEAYMGGLQTHMAEALLFFAPFPNSYRRFLSHWSSPVNLEWDVDNRTVGLRVPDSPPEQRRIENRLAGSDVNPYLVIAASLACGYAGMTGSLRCRPKIEGSAYDVPFELHRSMCVAIDSLSNSKAMREILGDEFVTLYCAVKNREFVEFEERVPEWEQKELAVFV